MPITDYNKKKQLDVDSVSGTPTVDKAQPIVLKSGGLIETNNADSQNGSFSMLLDGNSIEGDYDTANYNQSSSSQENILQFYFKVNSFSDVEADNLRYTAIDGNGNEFLKAALRGSTSSSTVKLQDRNADWETSSVSDNQWHLIEIRNIDYTNETFDVYLNGTQEVSGANFSNSASDYGELDLSVATNSKVRLDDVTIPDGNGGIDGFEDGNLSEYSLSVTTDSTTGTGDIVIDFTNISDAQDIAVYDQDGNLLDYEIEDLDTTAETGVLWAYNSWTRDDSVQAQIAYGDNSQNVDRQNVTGTWSNTGQSALMVQHLQELATGTGNADIYQDSTANNIDGDDKVSDSGKNGVLGPGQNFDGVDDYIDFGDVAALEGLSAMTLVAWIQRSTDGEFDSFVTKASGGTGESGNSWSFRSESNSPYTIDWTIYPEGGGSSSYSPLQSSTGLSTGTPYHVAGTFSSNNTQKVYVDAAEENSKALSSFTTNDSPTSVYIGARGDNNLYMNGFIDAVRIYNEQKTDTWLQADYDASPKAGQVFFSQQAAEQITITNQTVSVSETQVTSTNPTPAVKAKINISIPETTVTATNPAPTITPGTAPINIAETQLTSNNLDFTVQAGKTTLETPVNVLTSTNPNPALNATFSVSVPETTATVTNPEPALTVGETIIVPETQIASTNPDITLQPEAASLSVAETQLTASVEPAALNRQVLIGTATNLTAENPVPELNAGIISVSVPETTATVTNPDLQLTPGKSKIQIERPTDLILTQEKINATAGAVTFNIPETGLTVTTEKISLAFDIQLTSPTKAIITTPNKYVDMQSHTFKKDDTGDSLTATLIDDNNPDGINIENVNDIKLIIQEVDGTKVLNKSVTVTDGNNGQVEYDWSSNDTPITEADVYKGKFKITDGTGKPETVPNEGHFSIKVEED